MVLTALAVLALPAAGRATVDSGAMRALQGDRAPFDVSEEELSSEIEPYSKHPSERQPYAICPPPTKVRVSCMSAVVPTTHGKPVAGPALEGSGHLGGFSPADLRSAYGLSTEGGEDLTVAITIAYDNPNAESDLAAYRSDYGLAPCTTANGCFKKVNQDGVEGSYPTANAGWALETSLDLDMVSAICPRCHILLVEADTNETEDLGIAVERAVTMGAAVISNSWAAKEFSGETTRDHYFSHPGIPVLFASGDWGYGVYYPAASPEAVAVGGTSLIKDSSERGWSETAWRGAGSGCSAYEKKPAWQKDAGCNRRTVADVSAVSDPATPVSVYDSYEESGWVLLGGTSVATPLIAGVEALSSSDFRAAGPSAFRRTGEGGGLFDVVEGENGGCGEIAEGVAADYLCQADVGYDGPTGWGSPDGTQSLPTAITEAATINSVKKATLHGAIYPRGLATKYRFEYGKTASYGNSVPIGEASAGSGAGYTEVSQPLEGLKGQTTYHYRIVATNAAGVFRGVDRSFGTTAPAATTGAASAIQASSAVLHASVNPEGLETSYYFEYGPTVSYGLKMPVRVDKAGSGTASVAVEAAVSELTGSETYHYRVTARNIAGVAHGEDMVFTTAPFSWVAETPPSPGESITALTGVDCIAENLCVAVGRAWRVFLRGYGTLAEFWDGKSWSVMSTPNPSGALNEGESRGWGSRLRDVSCVSATNCIAVGDYQESKGYFEGRYKPLAEHWNGSQWSIVPVPAPAGSVDAVLGGVSCVSATTCVAVGIYEEGSGSYKTLAVFWNGTSWTIQPTPNAAGYPLSMLNGVSCVSASACTAVGAYGETPFRIDGVLAERWDGTSWTMQQTPPEEPQVFSGPVLLDVSCTLAKACTAVGYYYAMGPDGYYRSLALAEDWNGTAWAVQPAPTPLGAGAPIGGETGYLSDVSCVSVSTCTAAGSYYSPTAAESRRGFRALVERTGEAGWSALGAVPVLPAPSGWWHEAELFSVSCLGGCMVVGESFGAPAGGFGPSYALAEREVELPVPPIASFLVGTPNPVAASSVAFDGSQSSDSDGTIESYEWDFGDGSTETGPAPAHVYAQAGRYVVTLTVTDDSDLTGTITRAVRVAAPSSLAVSKLGGGAGAIKGTPYAVNCPKACSSASATLYEGAKVVLTATAASGSEFKEWTGACSGVGACEVTLSGAVKAVGAKFVGIAPAIVNPKTLIFEKSAAGTGQGIVKASGLVCELSCTVTEVAYKGGTATKAPAKVTLRATPAAGSTFTGWSGCQSEPEGKCVVSMGEARTVSAKFAVLPRHPLTVAKTGKGAGVIKGKPGVSCTTACSLSRASLPEGAVVVLSAAPAGGSSFGGWSGCDSEPEGKCVVAMSAAKSVTANFGGTAKAIVNPQRLTLSKTGAGIGAVKALGLSCEVACTATEVAYTGGSTSLSLAPATVVLTASPSAGSKPVHWTGCELVVGSTCTVQMDQPKIVTAKFDPIE